MISFYTKIRMLQDNHYDRLSIKQAPEIFKMLRLPTHQYDLFCAKHGLYDVSVFAASHGMDDAEVQENLEKRFE